MANNRPAYVAPLLAVLALCSVAVPFLFWHDVWFGRGLSDQDLEQYLQDNDRPRKVQHALSQIAERIARGEAMERFYPRIAELARHPMPEVRTTAAWAMGQDNRSVLFRKSLLPLLRDRQPMVRRNAALSLVRFADANGRRELVGMLEPDLVSAPAGGELRLRLAPGEDVGSDDLLARIRTPQGTDVAVRSSFSGEVVQVLAADRARVSAGDPIARILPGRDQAWEALRGLYLVGEPEDLPAVERYARADPHASAALHRQAVLTEQAIRARSERNPNR